MPGKANKTGTNLWARIELQDIVAGETESGSEIHIRVLRKDHRGVYGPRISTVPTPVNRGEECFIPTHQLIARLKRHVRGVDVAVI